MKNTKNQLNHSLYKIDILERELKELKLRKEQVKLKQKEIYVGILNLPNFQLLFPNSLIWIYKNLLQINDDFPNDIFPTSLKESDFVYFREISEIEIEIEKKQKEIKKNKNKTSITQDKNYFLDPKEKMSEVQNKIKAYKRESLIIKPRESNSLDLKKLREAFDNYDEIDEEIEPRKNIKYDSFHNTSSIVNNLNYGEDSSKNKKNQFYEDNISPSENVRKLMNQRSIYKKELKTQVEAIEMKKKAQLKIERFFEIKSKQLIEIKQKKMDELLKEYNSQNIEQKYLEKLKKRAYFLFGVKEGEKFIEDNYKENLTFRIEKQILDQNLKGHDFLEKKMERIKKIKYEGEGKEVNYQFNPIYNKFPQFIDENNKSCSFFNSKNMFVKKN